MLKKILKTRRAETLLEVIMSLFVISLGAMATANMIVSAISANAYGKNNLIALNLAVEGIEAMRDIRDSNWLKYSYDKANCWNMLPNPGGVNKDDCTDAANLIAATNYTVDLNLQTMKWELTPYATKLGLIANSTPQGTDEFYRLWYFDMTGGSARQIFNSKNASIASPAIEVGQSPFFRMITVSSVGAAEMTVSSLVQWYEGSIVREVQLDTVLTNYNRIKVAP